MPFVPDAPATGRFVPDAPPAREALIAAPEKSLAARGDEFLTEAGKGLGEGVASLATGAIATPAAGLAGLGADIAQGVSKLSGGPANLPEDLGARTVEKVQDALTYKPRSEAGKKVVGALSYPGELLAKGADRAGEAAFPESPRAATGLRTLIEGLPMALGIKGAPKFKAAAGVKLAEESAAAATEKAKNAPHDKILADSKDAGLVVPPTQAADTFINNLLEGAAGQAKTGQKASIKNQPRAQEMARKALGLPEGAPLTADTLKGLRDTAGADYEAVRNAGRVVPDAQYASELDAIAQQHHGAATSFPKAAKDDVTKLVDSLKVNEFAAGDAIDQIKLLREDADKAFRQGDNRLGKANKQAALALEDAIDRHLGISGAAPDLVANYRKAREQIAKTYAVQAALDADGTINMAKFAADLKKGKVLAEELKLMGEFAGTFKSASQNLKRNVPDFSLADLLIGGAGGAAGGWPAITVAGARPALRSAMLSGPGQKALARQPTYGPSRATSMAANPATANILETLGVTLPATGHQQ